jgi:inner membrane protein
VENIAHTLVGYSLSKAGLEKVTPFATAVLLIGANLPDVEIVGSLFGANYLDSHRGVTHGAAGILALSFGLAGGFWIVSRIRKSGTRERLKLFPLWYVSLLGLLSHIFLDFFNDYGLRPWLPFSSRRYYGDLLSIVDPWLWLIFGSAAFLWTASQRGRIRWAILGSILALIAAVISSPAQGLLWVLGVSAALWIGRFLRSRGFNPSSVAWLAFFLYIGGLAVAHEIVLNAVRESGPALVADRILEVEVLPGRPASIRRWFVVMEAADTYYAADVYLQNGSSRPPQFDAFDKNLHNRYYRESLSQGSMAAMARFARFPFVRVEEGPAGSHTVLLRDLRYARNRTDGWGTVRATVPSR